MRATYGDQCVDVSTVKTLGNVVKEVKSEVRKWFQKQNTNFFKGGFQKLVQSRQKCIEMPGDFVEK